MKIVIASEASNFFPNSFKNANLNYDIDHQWIKKDAILMFDERNKKADLTSAFKRLECFQNAFINL